MPAPPCRCATGCRCCRCARIWPAAPHWAASMCVTSWSAGRSPSCARGRACCSSPPMRHCSPPPWSPNWWGTAMRLEARLSGTPWGATSSPWITRKPNGCAGRATALSLPNCCRATRSMCPYSAKAHRRRSAGLTRRPRQPSICCAARDSRAGAMSTSSTAGRPCGRRPPACAASPAAA
ncbi:hypothetical protein D9M68_844760 [compost metagenome]